MQASNISKSATMKVRVAIALLSYVALSAEASIIFGQSVADCVSAEGRKGHCVRALDCSQLRARIQPKCVKPCGIQGGQLMVCCQDPATPRTTPQRPVTFPHSTAIIGGSDPLRCGVAGPKRRLLRNISGGRNAPLGCWPWMTLLGLQDNSGIQWLCGGALISPKHVLTAAHCVVGSLTRLRVRLGEHDITTEADGKHQDLRVIRAALHPNRRGSQNDIAVLTLEKPARLGERVLPVCLPAKSEARLEGRNATVAGWGRIEFRGEPSPQLQEADVKVVNTKTCEDVYRSQNDFNRQFPGGGFNGRFLCASGERNSRGLGADACQGDSGGPLVASGKDGRFSIVGVVAGGVGCGNPVFPGVYTKVTSHLDWIQRQVR